MAKPNVVSGPGTVMYGGVSGYIPSGSHFDIALNFVLDPNLLYTRQASTDGGATWIPFAPGDPDLPPNSGNWSWNIAVPGGFPVRVVQK